MAIPFVAVVVLVCQPIHQLFTSKKVALSRERMRRVAALEIMWLQMTGYAVMRGMSAHGWRDKTGSNHEAGG
jgi:hypothetical protein